MCKKKFSIFLTLCYRNGSFKCFIVEKSLGPLGVKGVHVMTSVPCIVAIAKINVEVI